MLRPFRSVSVLVALVLAAATLTLAWPSAEADGGPFQRLSGFQPGGGAAARVHPDHYRAFRVDTGEIRAELRGAPRTGAEAATMFDVPTPAGGTERFAVQRTQVMEAGLAERHPEIQTWAGHSLDHSGTTIALDVTPMGFHASVRPLDGQGMWYVDPAYNRRGTTAHLSYYGGSLPRPEKQFVEREAPDLAPAIARREAKVAAGARVKQRVYRLALLSDPTYADYFGSRNVLAEKVTLMTRVNQLYNDDVAIMMRLVDGTDELNLDTEAKATGPNGPCGAHSCYTNDPDAEGYVQGQIAYCDVGTLQRNMTVLGQLIGASNYDIGHLALGTNGGGIAGLGVVGSIEKGMGCTGIPDPVGDYYAIDYVAHEMGHQFGGNHTFNGTRWNCAGGNRNAGTSVEPGSGSSIMAYAGICRQDNLQPHSDPYFSQRSIQEITGYTSHRAAPPVEVQDVSFKRFDDSDSFTLSYGDDSDTVTITRGDNYNADSIEAAVEEMTGEDVTVAGWGYDPYAEIYDEGGGFPADLTAPNRTGFQVMFAGDPDPYTDDSDRRNMDALVVTPTTDFSARVGETAQGGPADNLGHRVITSRNHAPVVRAPANRTIPMRTPFTLRGHARDRDGDRITYLWEQNDRGARRGTSLVDNTKRTGPLFRVFGTFAHVSDRDAAHSPAPGENIATTRGVRTFPDMRQVLNGNTNARTGRCPRAPAPDPDVYVEVPIRVVNCFSEFLPVRGYVGRPGRHRPAMHFRLTARDGVLGGGGVGHDDVTLRLARKAGPFLVRTFHRHGSVQGGHRHEITWAVNGTRHLARKVRILLSFNNGRTWRTVLARRTPNDGRVMVRFPKRKTRSARIMIQARGNYFFDVNDAKFRIR